MRCEKHESNSKCKSKPNGNPGLAEGHVGVIWPAPQYIHVRDRCRKETTSAGLSASNSETCEKRLTQKHTSIHVRVSE